MTKDDAIHKMMAQFQSFDCYWVTSRPGYLEHLRIRIAPDDIGVTGEEAKGRLPMRTQWYCFDNGSDLEYWKDHEAELFGAGFTVMEYSDYYIYEYFLGLDGFGYDIVEAHWEPLYDAMGYNWHTVRDDQYRFD